MLIYASRLEEAFVRTNRYGSKLRSPAIYLNSDARLSFDNVGQHYYSAGKALG